MTLDAQTNPPGRPIELSGGICVHFGARCDGDMKLGGEQATVAAERLRKHYELEGLVAASQVHGVQILSLRDASDGAQNCFGGADATTPGVKMLGEGDGMLSNAPDVGMMVLTADCLPLVLCAEGRAVLLHAGWRGLAGGIIKAGAAAVSENGRRQIEVALIGPGAGACCYEVGPEVHRAFSRPAQSAALIDLKSIAAASLKAIGASKVIDLGICTICDQRYFSFRREGQQAGRQATLAFRKRRQRPLGADD